MFKKKKPEEDSGTATISTNDTDSTTITASTSSGTSTTETTTVPETTSSPKKSSKGKCPNGASPDGKHKMFHNEGTDETYCIYCGLS